MPRLRRPALPAALLLAPLILTHAAVCAAQSVAVIPGGQEEAIQRFLAPGDTPFVPGADYQAEAISIRRDRISVRYEDLAGAGPPVTLRVMPPADPCPEGDSAGSFGCVVHREGPPETGRAIRRQLAARAGEAPGIWAVRTDSREVAERSLRAGTAVPYGPGGPAAARRTRWVMQGLWGLLALLGLATLWTTRKECSRTTLLLWGGLFLGAFALRVAAATFGPGDLKMVDEAALLGVADAAPYHGPAGHALLVMWFGLVGQSDHAIVWLNLVLGSAAVPLAGALARALTGSRWAAVGAAVALALQPLLIRQAGEAARQPQVLFLAAVAGWSLVRSLTVRSWWAGGLAAVAMVLAVADRPEAVLLVGVLPLLGAAAVLQERRRPALAAVVPWLLGAAACGYYLATWGVELRGSGDLWPRLARTFPWYWTPGTSAWLQPALTPAAWLAGLGLAVVLGVGRRRWWGAAVVAGLAACAVPLSAMPILLDGALQLTSVRYQTVPLWLFCVGAGGGLGLGLAWLWGRGGWVRWTGTAVTAVAVVATTVVPARLILPPTTLDAEYAFLRRVVPELPENSRIYCPYNQSIPGDYALKPPVHLSEILGRPDVEWRLFPDEWEPESHPGFLLRQSACPFILQQLDKAYEALSEPRVEQLGAFCRVLDGWYGDVEPAWQAAVPYRPYMALGSSARGTEVSVGLYPLQEKDVLMLRKRQRQPER